MSEQFSFFGPVQIVAAKCVRAHSLLGLTTLGGAAAALAHTAQLLT